MLCEALKNAGVFALLAGIVQPGEMLAQRNV